MAPSVEIVLEQLTEFGLADLDRGGRNPPARSARAKCGTHVARICREVNATCVAREPSNGPRGADADCDAAAYLHDGLLPQCPIAPAPAHSEATAARSAARTAITKGDACDVCSTTSHRSRTPGTHIRRLQHLVPSAKACRRRSSKGRNARRADLVGVDGTRQGQRYAIIKGPLASSGATSDRRVGVARWRRLRHDPARIGRLGLVRRDGGAARRRDKSGRRRGARPAHPPPDPEEQTEYDARSMDEVARQGALGLPELPSSLLLRKYRPIVRRARAGAANELVLRSRRRSVGVNPSVFTYR